MSFVDLASERLGGRVLLANDEFFAEKENLLKPGAPMSIDGKYTDRGKWMDGWETRRRRGPGHDWCVVALGLPGSIAGVTVDTSHFLANYPEACSLEACLGEDPDVIASAERQAGLAEADEELEGAPEGWTELLARTPLEGDAENRFDLGDSQRLSHVRLRIYPDGGVARLRVWGTVLPDWSRLIAAGEPIDLISVRNGGLPLVCSNEFYGGSLNLIRPDRAISMADGWETGRRRGPGYDWVILQLGRPGVIESVEVDTAFFKGNYPESCSLEGCDAADPEAVARGDVTWFPLLGRTRLSADHRHVIRRGLASHERVSHVRFSIYPDGGVSRLRLFGHVV